MKNTIQKKQSQRQIKESPNKRGKAGGSARRIRKLKRLNKASFWATAVSTWPTCASSFCWWTAYSFIPTSSWETPTARSPSQSWRSSSPLFTSGWCSHFWRNLFGLLRRWFCFWASESLLVSVNYHRNEAKTTWLAAWSRSAQALWHWTSSCSCSTSLLLRSALHSGLRYSTLSECGRSCCGTLTRVAWTRMWSCIH